MTAESCESCGVVARLFTIVMDEHVEPFRVCQRCAAARNVPQRLPFEVSVGVEEEWRG